MHRGHFPESATTTEIGGVEALVLLGMTKANLESFGEVTINGGPLVKVVGALIKIG